ncbi:ABC transporter substrate-binding protein [Gemella sp. GH3]|uniref:ABC transporter substrate-binding protein n=1 Tax=unclassified Gemella TaxID=2624949 RepID=UPI0015CF9C66|nr:MULTISPECIES: ABC transporter substrate-binding protein [unclassified Gemella]MBF0713701.1 ABC transporter substrate-binding protein [Gemella sp. GH3.1]NYS50653.1 ABC transporter substrate-binding protein [Gemella sp. GH3]
MKKIIYSIMTVILMVTLVACQNNKEKTETQLKKVDFILDWAPNTNHTGLYVAKEKGYFKEIGIDLDVKLPPEDSSSDLVINNKAPFTIYFQDSMANKLAKGAKITAVAAIVENNTSGIISKASENINSPKDLESKKYGTWNDPIELAMIKNIVENNGGSYNNIKLVPNSDSNSITSIENNIFDASWIYYGWDGIMAKKQNIDTNFFYLKDYNENLNYYSPIIIANNDYLKNNNDEAKKIIQAIKKGYQYTIDNPEEAAEILIKYSPELKNKREFVIESQKYLSKQYATNKEKWGEIDPTRWSNFYKWINENNIIDNKLQEDSGFTNEYVK